MFRRSSLTLLLVPMYIDICNLSRLSLQTSDTLFLLETQLPSMMGGIGKIP